MISLIAAVGRNRELGINNNLIWKLHGDMKYFREQTSGKTVVMGRKTYLSIGSPLPKRKNIVISRSIDEIDGVEVIHDPKDILEMSKEEDIFIIGGSSIYEYFIPYADKIYLTEIDGVHDADAFFPEFDKSLYQKEILDKRSEDGVEYAFVIYQKKIFRK